jgi:diguanylate cyclase (GGDEF)-like protein/PAS domain S-box-containing protein
MSAATHIPCHGFAQPSSDESVIALRAANDMLAFLVDSFERSGMRMAQMDSVPELQSAPQVQKLAQRVARLVRRFEETLNHIAVGVVMVDSNGRMQLCNTAAMALLELPEHLVKPRPMFNDVITWQIMRGEFTAAQILEYRAVSGHGLKDTNPLFRRTRPNGTILDVRTVVLADGGFVRTFTDVTEDVRQQSRLEAAEAEYRGLFENATIGVYRSSIDGKQLRANPALVRINGFNSEEEMLASVNCIAGEWYVDPARRDEFKALMARDGRVSDFVSEVYRHKTRERIWISENAWLVTDQNGETWYEGTITEATQRIEAQQRIAYLALHDQTTGLANRISLLEQVGKALSATNGRRVAAFLIDLDGFKSVNDTFGHAAGDEVLRQVAQTLKLCIEKDDVVARYGGDEFVVFRPRVTCNLAETGVAAATLVQALKKPFMIDGRAVFMGGSVGVAIAEAGEITASDLLRHADIALYRAKSEGKQTYRFFDPVMMANLEDRLAMEAELRRAIADGEFELHYQPIVSIPDRKLTAYEALIRWHRPGKGLVAPGAFISIAESSGLMLSIGEWVIDAAARQLGRLPGDVSISINVSPIQLRQRGFVEDFAGRLRHRKADPRRMIIELTESVFIEHEDTVTSALTGLRDLGVRIALDDFGTGYSALGYLQRFRFDRIKLDQSFLRKGAEWRTNAAIARVILGLGRDLDIPIIAEGIEDETQLAFLLENGCTYAQGYLFGRPGPLPATAKRGAKVRDDNRLATG